MNRRPRARLAWTFLVVPVLAVLFVLRFRGTSEVKTLEIRPDGRFVLEGKEMGEVRTETDPARLSEWFATEAISKVRIQITSPLAPIVAVLLENWRGLLEIRSGTNILCDVFVSAEFAGWDVPDHERHGKRVLHMEIGKDDSSGALRGLSIIPLDEYGALGPVPVRMVSAEVWSEAFMRQVATHADLLQVFIDCADTTAPAVLRSLATVCSQWDAAHPGSPAYVHWTEHGVGRFVIPERTPIAPDDMVEPIHPNHVQGFHSLLLLDQSSDNAGRTLAVVNCGFSQLFILCDEKGVPVHDLEEFKSDVLQSAVPKKWFLRWLFPDMGSTAPAEDPGRTFRWNEPAEDEADRAFYAISDFDLREARSFSQLLETFKSRMVRLSAGMKTDLPAGARTSSMSGLSRGCSIEGSERPSDIRIRVSGRLQSDQLLLSLHDEDERPIIVQVGDGDEGRGFPKAFVYETSANKEPILLYQTHVQGSFWFQMLFPGSISEYEKDAPWMSSYTNGSLVVELGSSIFWPCEINEELHARGRIDAVP